jgi:hypothetical protein
MLYDDGFNIKGPEPDDYTKMLSIPARERCHPCEGLGLVRWRTSNSGNDWMRCWFCKGTGRAPKGVPTVGDYVRPTETNLE